MSTNSKMPSQQERDNSYNDELESERHFRQAALYLDEKNFPNALEKYEILEKNEKYRVIAQMYTCLVYILQGQEFEISEQFTEALKCYTLAIEKSSKIIFPKNIFDMQQLRNEMYFVYELDYGYSLFGLKSKALKSRANLNVKLVNYRDALSDYSLLVEIEESSELYILRAQIHFNNKNWNSAIEDYKRALELDKDSEIAKNELLIAESKLIENEGIFSNNPAIRITTQRGRVAYKDLTWGMSVDDVKEIYPDLEMWREIEFSYGNPGVWWSDFNVLGQYLNCIYNNYIIVSHSIPQRNHTFRSRSNSIAFYFDENQLRYVYILNTRDIDVNDLIRRYGKPEKRVTGAGLKPYPTRDIQELFIEERNRFTLLIRQEWDTDSGTYGRIDRILYLDRDWFTQVFTNYFTDYKKDHAAQVNRILD
jgi:tetratricopeptide (TPR) repeat protein